MENSQNCCLLIFCDVICRGNVQGKISFTADNFQLCGSPIDHYQEVKELAQRQVETFPEYHNPLAVVTNIINLTQVFKYNKATLLHRL